MYVCRTHFYSSTGVSTGSTVVSGIYAFSDIDLMRYLIGSAGFSNINLDKNISIRHQLDKLYYLYRDCITD